MRLTFTPSDFLFSRVLHAERERRDSVKMQEYHIFYIVTLNYELFVIGLGILAHPDR